MRIIATVAIAIVFVVDGIMVGWEATRRSADDETKIRQSYRIVEDTTAKERLCLEGGGLPNYDRGGFVDCRTKE